MKKIFLDYHPSEAHDAVCPDGEVESVRKPIGEAPATTGESTSLLIADPEVRFSLRRDACPGYNSSSVSLASADVTVGLLEGDHEAAESLLADGGDEAFGALQEATRREICRKVKAFVDGYMDECEANLLLCSPRLVVAALRFPDGRRAAVGSVALMMADSGAPLPEITGVMLTDNALTMSVSLLSHPCRLYIAFDNPGAVSQTGATHIDILMSEMPVTYRRDDEVCGIMRVSGHTPLYSVSDRKYQLSSSRGRCCDIGALSASAIDKEVLSLHGFKVAASLECAVVADYDPGVAIAVGKELHACCGSGEESVAIREIWQPEILSASCFVQGFHRHLCNAAFRLPVPTLSQRAEYSAGYEKIFLQAEVVKEGRRLFSRVGECVVDSAEWQSQYLFYPDEDAVAIHVIRGDGSGVRLPLRRCAPLGGAFHYGGIGYRETVPQPCSVKEVEDEYIVRRRVFTGRMTSPCYPVSSAEFPCDVYAVASAMRTPGGTQPGQYPLYCITVGGIWLARLEEERIVAVQLLSGAGPLSAVSWKNIDGGIEVATDSGELTVRGTSVSRRPIYYEEREDVELLTRPLKLSGSCKMLLLQPAVPGPGVRLQVEASAGLRLWHVQTRVGGMAVRGQFLPSAPYMRLRLRLPVGSILPRALLLR